VRGWIILNVPRYDMAGNGTWRLALEAANDWDGKVVGWETCMRR